MKLEIKNLTKTFDGAKALTNVSVTLNPGVYGLLGANGSGKTTLFRLICGVIKADEGKIIYNGEDISLNGEMFRSVLGFLPQDFSYYADFTGLKFMLYIAALKGLRGKLAKQRSLELLDLVGLSEQKGKKIKKYSGGMKQRLGIAQAMINDPEVLILDEPTVGLDPKERVRFRNLISSLSDNKIIILSTHIVSDVESISDEVLVLNKGVIQDRGSVNQLLKKIENSVWEVRTTQREMKSYYHSFSISNQKYEGDDVVLRIISAKKPANNAVQAKANLEDLYLYYFRTEVLGECRF
ncbi:ABC transporter ATP-binding protein [Enterococcus durans]|uniref:ABC transporter ATP-binding protein n=1 Tax=Enterococcus durans TaxID=53345 RepID=UPI0009BFAD78|nr:ABC transporter ATP-binding protein [Enterococcus durans]MBC9707569.1 ABC transporter ATP-binding protein [Enterococcus sp.]ASV95940.1 ABC transporter ATP-binding protein [Enterococcus durans]MBX9041359.1 ABC transporter ATP-binding protein [Enterococcus durans]MBX9078097.1 ABC transporter ATP-binding protein [Enterococcus durans]MCB8504263.1 ABC transporter ATP-binding protein [Enterococcus durans]